MSDDFLSSLSFHLKDLVAPGMAGGIGNVLLLREHRPWEIIRGIALGTLAAYYFSPVVSSMLGWPLGTSGFAVGLAGAALCQRILDWAGGTELFKGQRKND